GGPAGLGQQGAQDDPVVGADGAGAVGAPRGVLVKGAGAPDVGAGAMDLGVVAGPDPVAMPGAVGQVVEAAGQAPLEEGEVPGAILGEGLQGLPVVDPGQADQRLGDGVSLDIEGQAGDPFDEALLAAAREADGGVTPSGRMGGGRGARTASRHSAGGTSG